MLPRLFNLIEGSLYRTPLRLTEADVHKLSWDVGYHHAVRGHEARPNNPFVKDADSYMLGYEAAKNKGAAKKESEAKAQADAEAGAAEAAETKAREGHDQALSGALQSVRQERGVFHTPGELSLADTVGETPDSISAPDPHQARIERQNRKRLERMPGEIADIRSAGVGMTIGKGHLEHRLFYDTIETETKRRAFHAEGRDLIEQNQELSAKWSEASDLIDGLRGLEADPDYDTTTSHHQGFAKKVNEAIEGAVSGLMGAMGNTAADLSREYLTPDEFEESSQEFTKRFGKRVFYGDNTGDGRLAKSSGSRGGDLIPWHKKQLDKYLGEMFRMWGPAVSYSLRKIEEMLYLPIDEGEHVRAHYSPAWGDAARLTFQDMRGLGHEFGHHIEHFVGAGRYWSRRLDARAEGEPERLADLTGQPSYGGELAVKDKWGAPYMGKVYEGRNGRRRPSTEIVSMLNEAFGEQSEGYDSKWGSGATWRNQFMADRSLLVEYAGFMKACARGGLRKERALRDGAAARAEKKRQAAAVAAVAPVAAPATKPVPSPVPHNGPSKPVIAKAKVEHPEHGKGVVALAKEGYPLVKVRFGRGRKAKELKLDRSELRVI